MEVGREVVVVKIGREIDMDVGIQAGRWVDR